MCATGSGRTANTFEVIIVCVRLEGVLDYTIPEPRANRSGDRAAFHRVAGLSRSPLFVSRITAWNSALTYLPGYITSTQGICCNCIINVVMERRHSSLYLLQVYLKPLQKTFETVAICWREKCPEWIWDSFWVDTIDLSIWGFIEPLKGHGEWWEKNYEIGRKIIQCFCVLSQKNCVSSRNFAFASRSTEISVFLPQKFISKKFLEQAQSFTENSKVEWTQKCHGGIFFSNLIF